MFLFVSNTFTQILRHYITASCVKLDFCYTFQSGFASHKADKHFHLLPSLTGFLLEELKLIVSHVAIQLWSRALLQGCHDRINENNIKESHFIHMLLRKNQRPHFGGKYQQRCCEGGGGFKMKPELTTQWFMELKKWERSEEVQSVGTLLTLQSLTS